ncbi:unnamed protein product [Dicrocoelium dendriticum]|nr:unnamed protein product [Dicrocoelium dendriticum]
MTHTDCAGAAGACHTDVDAQRDGSEDQQDAGVDESSIVVQENVSVEGRPGGGCFLQDVTTKVAGAASSWTSKHHISDTVRYVEPTDPSAAVHISSRNTNVVHTHLEL